MTPLGVFNAATGDGSCEYANASLRLLYTSVPDCADVRRDFTSFALEAVISIGIAPGPQLIRFEVVTVLYSRCAKAESTRKGYEKTITLSCV